LGASIPDVVRLLSAEFLLMILLSFAIAAPVIMWGAKEWLNNYELKSNPGAMLYLLPLVSTFIIGLLTVVTKTFFAAQQNPIKSLRTE
jgi:putative ABC transport system permease protein